MATKKQKLTHSARTNTSQSFLSIFIFFLLLPSPARLWLGEASLLLASIIHTLVSSVVAHMPCRYSHRRAARFVMRPNRMGKNKSFSSFLCSHTATRATPTQRRAHDRWQTRTPFHSPSLSLCLALLASNSPFHLQTDAILKTTNRPFSAVERFRCPVRAECIVCVGKLNTESGFGVIIVCPLFRGGHEPHRA